MKISIAIQDNKGREEAESMNLPFTAKIEQEDFWFKISMLESMWHDKGDDELVLGINGSDYRTPYNEALFETCRNEIEGSSTRGYNPPR